MTMQRTEAISTISDLLENKKQDKKLSEKDVEAIRVAYQVMVAFELMKVLKDEGTEQNTFASTLNADPFKGIS